MTTGRLIAVVGPSGVGKDSVMAGIIASAPQFQLVRRAITRAPELGGEDYDAMAPEAFERAVERGAFCVHWGAHGLRYGIPAQVRNDVQNGAHCLANLSRGALPDAAAVFPDLCVLNITAAPATLAKRLSARGRESTEEIERRLTRVPHPFPEGMHVIDISNDGPLDETVQSALAALQPVRA